MRKYLERLSQTSTEPIKQCLIVGGNIVTCDIVPGSIEYYKENSCHIVKSSRKPSILTQIIQQKTENEILEIINCFHCQDDSEIANDNQVQKSGPRPITLDNDDILLQMKPASTQPFNLTISDMNHIISNPHRQHHFVLYGIMLLLLTVWKLVHKLVVIRPISRYKDPLHI